MAVTAKSGGRVWLWLAALLSTGHIQAETGGDPTPESLYESMAKATRELNYDGVFVYSRGADADSMRVIHRADQHGEQERIVSLSGSPREVIRSNDTVKCYLPDRRAVMIEKRTMRKFLPSFRQPASEIAVNYQFELIGRDRIAGRRAWVIGVLPRNAFRYGYRFWVDAENRLLLRSEVVNSRGAVLEQILFTQLTLPATIADELLQPAVNSENFTTFDKSRSAEGPSLELPVTQKWLVQWVPQGFSQRDYKIQRLSASDSPVDHIVFSDGLATISVFVEKLKDKADSLEGFTAVGAVNTYSRLNDNYQVTVVGEVPPLTVRQVAGSVVLADKH
ncbi:MAG: Sigma factor AlgU regulatory protein MucB [Gammaproteobacteria bacterium]|nr:Sigma factor AlgU regulatory protein MucB [Gammaproteobacteria bacterium]